MSRIDYYPHYLKVRCPTHGPQIFAMREQHEMYVCLGRDEMLPIVDIARQMKEEPKFDGANAIRLIHDYISDQSQGWATCLWVVPLEHLHNNPDGGDPIKRGGTL